ncbi:MAG TPA: hypothetical protein VIY73_29035 [Polyangiaceae bacterium]
MGRSIPALVVLLGCGLASTGCSYSMNEYQAAGYEASLAAASPPGAPPPQARWIHARAEQGVVLGVTDNTHYVDVAYADLLSQCPGEIVGVNTRYSTKLGFLSYRNTVDMQAFCLR